MRTHRVLFVSQDMPWPAESGGVIRTHRMLAGLARRFEVTLVAGGAQRAGAGRAALEALGCAVELVPDVKRPGRIGEARALAGALLTGQSMVLRHNHNPHLARAVAQRLGGNAGVQLNQLDSATYVDAPRAAGGPACVIDTQNVLHQYYARRAEHEGSLPARLACRREARVLRRYELAAFRAAARTVVCSEPERASLLALDPSLAVEVVPNGVDLDPAPRGVAPSGAGFDLVFVGDMRYGPNVDGALYFAREVLPRIRVQEPRARFVVVGKEPPRSLRELSALRPEIVVTGYVRDVREPVLAARAALVPLRYGSGTRLKVLEAFALERPLVATRLGAEGIEARDGQHLLLADTPDELARAVLRVFAEPELGARLAAAARALVERDYAWPALAERMADVLAAAIEERPRA